MSNASFYGLLLFFSFGKIVYTFIHKKDSVLRALEVVSTAVFFGVSDLIFFKFGSENLAAVSVAIGALFIISGLVSRRIAKMLGATESGITDFVWISAMGIALGIILYVYNYDVLNTSYFKGGFDQAYYELASSEIRMFIDKTVDCLIYLALVLGACMTILWAGLTRVMKVKKSIVGLEDGLEMKDVISKETYLFYRGVTRTSLAMAFAGFWIILATLIWVIHPLYYNLNLIKEFLQ